MDYKKLFTGKLELNADEAEAFMTALEKSKKMQLTKDEQERLSHVQYWDAEDVKAHRAWLQKIFS